MRYRLTLEELTGSQYLQPGGSFAFRASILRSASVISGTMASPQHPKEDSGKCYWARRAAMNLENTCCGHQY